MISGDLAKDLFFMITAAKRPKIGCTKYAHIFGHLAAKQKSRRRDATSGPGVEIFAAMRKRLRREAARNNHKNVVCTSTWTFFMI